MYSVAPLVLRKALADVQIGRYTIPAGTAILIHVFAMHNTSHNYERHTEFLPVSPLPITLHAYTLSCGWVLPSLLHALLSADVLIVDPVYRDILSLSTCAHLLCQTLCFVESGVIPKPLNAFGILCRSGGWSRMQRWLVGLCRSRVQRQAAAAAAGTTSAAAKPSAASQWIAPRRARPYVLRTRPGTVAALQKRRAGEACRAAE